MRQKRAFSLIEVLAAVTILAIALLAFVKTFTVMRSTIDRGYYYTVATEAAASKIADLQGGGYSNLVRGATNSTVSKLPGSTMTVWIGYLDYSGWNSGENIRQIDVWITWPAGNAQSMQAGGSLHQCCYIAQRR